MSDPLTEAREALRYAIGWVADASGPEDYFEEILARLDALPAPIRCVDSTELGGTPAGWHYPDPESAS